MAVKEMDLGSVVGPQGPKGDVPEIGSNGNWWIGGKDTGVAVHPQAKTSLLDVTWRSSDVDDAKSTLKIVRVGNVVYPTGFIVIKDNVEGGGRKGYGAFKPLYGQANFVATNFNLNNFFNVVIQSDGWLAFSSVDPGSYYVSGAYITG